MSGISKTKEIKTRCPICGTEFYIVYDEWKNVEWAYKKKKANAQSYVFFCSWKCLREREKIHDKKTEQLKQTRQRTRPPQKNVWIAYDPQGYPTITARTITELAEKLGKTVGCVNATMRYYRLHNKPNCPYDRIPVDDMED